LRHLGRSVNAELRRKRLEYCRRLLVTTSLPIADIAPQCGFVSAAYLGSVFREAFGTTPHKWRTAAST
jgi:AraC family transcriptional regulator